MRKFLIAAALAAAGPAIAQTLEGRQGDDWVRLFEGPCVSAETLARIEPDARKDYRKAQGEFRGERFFGCWQMHGNAAFIQWEDGDQGIVPAHELKPALEI